MFEHVEMLAQVTNLAQVPVPDPPAELPPGFDRFSNTIIGWLKGVAFAVAVGMFVVSGLMVMAGRRRSNQVATEGVFGTLWVAGGLAIVGSAALFVGAFI